MFLDEKIERLKQKFLPTDFKVPFTTGSDILKSIEAEFIFTKDVNKDLNNLRQRFNYWADNIKHKTEVDLIDLRNHHKWVDKLVSDTNYWIVLAYKTSPSLKHFVYDCKPNALLALVSITQDDFYVVDKKYNWFSYFQVDKSTLQATVFRSGEKLTPFDA